MKTPTPDKMETLLNKLKREVKISRQGGEKEHEKDWNRQMGILISRAEAQEIISLLKGGWVKCEDSLPPTNDTVLLYRSNKPYYLGRFHEGKWQIQGCTSNSQCTPSRWAPLLPKPTE
jgi:hypothetical protein